MIIKKKRLVTVDILYWIPDYRHILQEFIWQTDDLVPEMPRVHKFLNFWHENIDAVISEIRVMDGDENSFLPVKETYTLQ
jgi:uncharacterized protein Usg|tara:strand:+ start:967 stop:1206 length:240 start_codon:yes stop_codon:yes gene_type:complete